jgi:outer membrane biosynthesis protein TonB
MEKRNKVLIAAIALSLLLHIAFFLLPNLFDFKASPPENETTDVTILFPENRPKARQIVENINENELKPNQSNLLSDRNSQARTPQKIKQRSSMPKSSGRSSFPSLTQKPSQQQFKRFKSKKFSSKALTGVTHKAPQKNSAAEENQSVFQKALNTNPSYYQPKFSGEEMGALSLSTYAWEWTPYIHKLKAKLHRVWTTPPAYHRLGIISGHTAIQFTIGKNGKLKAYKLLHHQGHSSLQTSSEQAIKALFQFLPLPENFPEEDLTITAKLIYPSFKQGK